MLRPYDQITVNLDKNLRSRVTHHGIITGATDEEAILELLGIAFEAIDERAAAEDSFNPNGGEL